MAESALVPDEYSDFRTQTFWRLHRVKLDKGIRHPELQCVQNSRNIYISSDDWDAVLTFVIIINPISLSPIVTEKEAEQRGAVYQIHSARPKGMSLKAFQKIEKCWRRRKRTEELYPPSKLPPLGTDLQVMMTREEVENLIFLHEENLGKLGQAVTDDSGNTLTDLVAEGKLKNAVPANASDAHRNQRFSDCAVVASGATLQGASLGKKIDEHQVVVRINQAPTASSKRIVGSKTSIRLINNLWTKSYAKADLRRKAVESGSSSTPVEGNLTIYVTRPSADDYMKLLRHSQQFRKDVELRIVSSRIVSMVRDRLLAPYRKKLEMAGVDEFKAALLEGRDTPSSGLVAVFLMIQLCGSVTAYGFSGINDGSKYHYWKSNRQYQNRTHSFSAERALLRRLAYELDTFFFVEGNTDNVKSFV